MAEAALPLAAAVGTLLEEPSAWRHRRTERFDFVSAEEVRRSVSIDFTVPRELWDGLRLWPPDESGRGDDGQWIVPLGWLARGVLVGFDLRKDGASLPLLLASEIEVVTRALLALEIELAIDAAPPPGLGDSIVTEAAALADAVCGFVTPTDIGERIEAFAARYGDPVEPLCALLRTAAAGYLLLVLVPRVDRRQLVKFAFDERLGRAIDSDAAPGGLRGLPGAPRRILRRALFWPDLELQTPGVLEAASTHLEARLPTELRVRGWELQDLHTGAALSPSATTDSDHPALYLTSADVVERQRCAERETGSTGTPGVPVRFKVERWRFHLPGLVLAAMVTVALSYGAWVAKLSEVVSGRAQGPIVTLLLAGVALFVALALRLDEHSLARRLLVVPRAMLVLILAATVTAAGALAFGGQHLQLVWKITSIAAAALSSGLTISSLRSAAGSART